MATEIYYNPDDTICAISTAQGTGGVALVRVSGKDTIEIVSKIWKGIPIPEMRSHTAHLGDIIDPSSDTVIDQVVLTIFRTPKSFTGENVVEISMHGSVWIQRRIIKLLIENGARLALPGEFTRRAFAAGKLDLAEAEAVADVIASKSEASHRLAISQMRGGYSQKINEMRRQLVELASLLELELDFSEEDVEFASRNKLIELSTNAAAAFHRLANSYSTGAAIKTGISVAIVGRTNVGKSSLMNAIVGDERAIVSDIHGTTRDIVEENIELGSYSIRFKDTAGIRHSEDPIENMGIDRSRKALETAEIVVCVVDASDPQLPKDITLKSCNSILVVNKIDKCEYSKPLPLPIQTICVSAKTGEGIEELKDMLIAKIEKIHLQSGGNNLIITNARHAEALESAAQSLDAVISGLNEDIPSVFIAQELRAAIRHLSSITGEITTPEILQTIFSRFCIGK